MKLSTLGSTFVVGGLLIAFGALGGMEAQPEVPLLTHVLAALSGVIMMAVGVKLIKE